MHRKYGLHCYEVERYLLKTYLDNEVIDFEKKYPKCKVAMSNIVECSRRRNHSLFKQSNSNIYILYYNEI